jgi:hypothetical protein
MKKIFFAAIFISLVSLSPLAYAAEFIQNGSAGQITVPASETHKNLYTVGGSVTINGATTGDLTVAGGTVVVSGPVSGELLAAGGNVVVNSKIDGTARIAGGSIVINNPIGGDLVVAGGTVSVAAPVSGDLVVGGGSVTVNAPIGGSVRIAGGSVVINSTIGGTVNVTANKSFTVGPAAVVVGTINYKGVQPANVDASAKIGAINFTKITPRARGVSKGFLTFGVLVQVIALMIVGFLLLRLRRRTFTDTNAYIYARPWSSLGLGILGLIVIPIAVIILFITFIGYYAALIVLLAYILMVLLTTVMSALFVGSFILRLFRKSPQISPDWQIVVLGVIVWELLAFIPIVGWIVLLVVYLMVFGASLVGIKNRLGRQEQLQS